MQNQKEPCGAQLPAPRCPICGSASTRHFASGSDRLFGVAPGVFILHSCEACECIFQHPLPGEDVLPGYYPQTYWWAEETVGSGPMQRLAMNLERIYREWVAMDHVRFIERCSRGERHAGRTLLDVGCGTGTILYLAGRRGFQPFGVDVSSTAVSLAKRQYGLRIEKGTIGTVLWGGRRFDCITMHHVLEHLVDPLEALRCAAGLLKQNGSLIVQVPNISSMQARFFGKHWYGLDVPRHLINFSPRALKLLLQRAGFEIHGAARFSLRDNPASIASSLVPGLDPIGRKVKKRSGALTTAALDLVYLMFFGLSLPLALLESSVGRGGTIWVHARPV